METVSKIINYNSNSCSNWTNETPKHLKYINEVMTRGDRVVQTSL